MEAIKKKRVNRKIISGCEESWRNKNRTSSSSKLFINYMNNPKSQPANVKVVCRFRPFNKQEL